MYKYAQVCGTCDFSSRGWTGLNMFLITLELTNHSKKMKRLYARRFMCKSRTDRVAKGLCQRVAQKVVSERGALDLQYSVNTTGMSMNVKVLWALPWRGATPITYSLPIHHLFHYLFHYLFPPPRDFPLPIPNLRNEELILRKA